MYFVHIVQVCTVEPIFLKDLWNKGHHINYPSIQRMLFKAPKKDFPVMVSYFLYTSEEWTTSLQWTNYVASPNVSYINT